jgi:hypothetical protein
MLQSEYFDTKNANMRCASSNVNKLNVKINQFMILNRLDTGLIFAIRGEKQLLAIRQHFPLAIVTSSLVVFWATQT